LNICHADRVSTERRCRAVVLLATLFLLTPASAVRADLPSIRFDRMKPLGTAAGSEVLVEILGADIEDAKALLFDHPGLSATPVADKEKQFTVRVAADVPAGTYDVYLVGRFGVSNSRLFAVSHGLNEVEDNGKNRTLEDAQPVEINSAINGSADGNAEDFYRFPAKQGQRVVIDCQAQRLDSELDATLTLKAATGTLLASNGDYFGQDPMVDFVAPADGDYIVSLADLSFRGGYPYRLIITDRPVVENVFPPVLQAGQTAKLTALGRNLTAAGGSATELMNAGLPLDRLEFEAPAPPSDLLELGRYDFVSHPTHHSVMPTAATCTLNGMQVRVPGTAGVWDAQTVLVTPDPVQLEAAGNDVRENAQAITLPAVVAGRFDQPRDADWYSFKPEADGPFSFDVYCERIAGRADPYLVIVDEKGNRQQELDDFGHRINAFDGHLRDPSQTVNLSKDRTYYAMVQDRYQRGGPRYQYVLEIHAPRPDFYAAAIHRSNPNPGGTTLFSGSSTWLDIVIHQKNYSGPVTISAEGLPPGVHFQPTVISNNSRGTFVMWSDVDAAEWTGLVKLYATGETDGQTFRREVRPHSRVWNNSGTSCPQRSLALAVRRSGPFHAAISPERIEVPAGGKVEAKVMLNRLWPDFKGKVTVQPLGFPGQFQLGNFDISEGQTEAALVIAVQPNTAPGEYTLTLQCQAQVPFSKDADATSRPNTLVTLPSQPVTIRVVPKAD